MMKCQSCDALLHNELIKSSKRQTGLIAGDTSRQERTTEKEWWLTITESLQLYKASLCESVGNNLRLQKIASYSSHLCTLLKIWEVLNRIELLNFLSCKIPMHQNAGCTSVSVLHQPLGLSSQINSFARDWPHEKTLLQKTQKHLATLQCCLLDRTRFFESIQALVANIHSDHLVTSHPNSMSEQVYIYIYTYHASVTIAKQTISNVQHYVHYKKYCVNKSVNMNTGTVRNPTHDPKEGLWPWAPTSPGLLRIRSFRSSKCCITNLRRVDHLDDKRHCYDRKPKDDERCSPTKEPLWSSRWISILMNAGMSNTSNLILAANV